jgi:glycosyltransferase involved in cell wall biosynthesis
LTYNEEKNIKAAIDSIKGISQRIIVVDSYSDDSTVEIAKKFGAEVIQNPFINQAQQYQAALKLTHIDTPWTLRLDADERISEEASKEIINVIKKDEPNINGIIVPFEVSFLGKKLRFGGIYPFKKMILYKTGMATMEQRSMDEHLVLKEGKAKTLRSISYHDDFKDLTAWIDKHNKYASREVLDYFSDSSRSTRGLNTKAKLKRFVKYNIYFKLPMSLRSTSYFLYRYIIKLGFLDGKPGFIFAVLQAFWYRFLVDAKIYELKRQKS